MWTRENSLLIPRARNMCYLSQLLKQCHPCSIWKCPCRYFHHRDAKAPNIWPNIIVGRVSWGINPLWSCVNVATSVKCSNHTSPRDTKITHFHLSTGWHKNVGGFHISVFDFQLCVQIVKSTDYGKGNLTQNPLRDGFFIPEHFRIEFVHASVHHLHADPNIPISGPCPIEVDYKVRVRWSEGNVHVRQQLPFRNTVDSFSDSLYSQNVPCFFVLHFLHNPIWQLCPSHSISVHENHILGFLLLLSFLIQWTKRSQISAQTLLVQADFELKNSI